MVLAAGRFRDKGNFYDLSLIVEHRADGAPGFQFQETGVALLKATLATNGEPDLSRATQVDAPLLHPVPGGGLLYFGCGILVNTAEAGAPDPDGYVYVYGRNGLHP